MKYILPDRLNSLTKYFINFLINLNSSIKLSLYIYIKLILNLNSEYK